MSDHTTELRKLRTENAYLKLVLRNWETSYQAALDKAAAREVAGLNTPVQNLHGKSPMSNNESISVNRSFPKSDQPHAENHHEKAACDEK